MLEFLRLLIHALPAPLRTQAQREAEIAMLQHQLNVLRRQTPRPRLTPADRLLFMAVSAVSVAEECPHDRSAGHGAALALKLEPPISNQVHAAALGAGLPVRVPRRRASSRAISYSRANHTPNASASAGSS
jgi:hypothetical protein